MHTLFLDPANYNQNPTPLLPTTTTAFLLVARSFILPWSAYFVERYDMYVVRSWSSRHARTSLDYLCIPNHRTLQCASPPPSLPSPLSSHHRALIHTHTHYLTTTLDSPRPPLCDEVFALLGLIACCTYGLLDDVTWRDETWWGCCLLLMMMRLSLSVCLSVS